MRRPISEQHLDCVLAAALLSWLATWVASPGAAAADSTGLSWSEPVFVAGGEAHVGPWRMNDSHWRYVDDATVAVDDRGRVAVAWVDQARKDVFFQFFDPHGEALSSEPVNVSRSPGIFSWLPRMVLGRDGRVHVLWQEIVFSGGSHGGEAFFARSTNAGRSFSNPTNLSNSRAGDGKGRLDADYWHNGSLDLTRSADGTLYAVWTEYEGRLWLSRSVDGGQSFSEPRLIAGTDERPARGPALATGPGSRVYLAWAVGEDAEANIRLAVSTDGGREFADPAVVGESDGHADAPKLAVGPDDTLHLVYGESPGGPLREYEVRYARSSDHGATFSPPRAIHRSIPEPYTSANFPGLGIDRGGRLYVLAHLGPGAGHRPRALGMAVSTGGGKTFSPLSLIPGLHPTGRGIVGSLQGMLVSKLATMSPGSLTVVTSTFVPNEGSSIRLVNGNL